VTTVIGGDLSMAASGIAIWRNGTTYTHTITTPATMDKVGRWRTVVQRIWAHVDGPTVVIVEDLPRGDVGGGTQLIERAGLLALVEYGCDARDIPFVLVNPSTLKVYATGKGNASKQDMLTAARHMRAEPGNHNEADAWWLATMALDNYRYGRTFAPNARQAEALTRVRWPHWTWKD
jgi:Holliday junction resolvasome RuvABC endonuclease subunit